MKQRGLREEAHLELRTNRILYIEIAGLSRQERLKL